MHNVPLDSELYFLRSSVRAEQQEHAGAAADLSICVEVRTGGGHSGRWQSRRMNADNVHSTRCQPHCDVILHIAF